ncbi:MAG: hypothetical protein KDA80_06210 [Planctomycetaceae bacterium]|nr:hypothetical protein [Planctomycetaceae bacterium]
MPNGNGKPAEMNAQQAQRIQDLLNSTVILWIGLAVALFALAIVIKRIRSRYRDGDDPADEPEEIIRQMEEMHRRGDLTEEEIRSIKSRYPGGSGDQADGPRHLRNSADR